MPAVQKGRRRNSSAADLELTAQHGRDIKEAFELFDENKDGAVDYHELKAAMLSLGFDLGKAEVLKILRDHGKSGEGLMNFENFAKISASSLLLVLWCQRGNSQ
jgi:centrin-3